MTMIEWYGYGEQRGEEEKMSVARCVPVLMLREAEAEDGDDENDSKEGEEEEMKEKTTEKSLPPVFSLENFLIKI